LAVPHDSALEIRDEVEFFQEIRAVLAKSISEGGGKSPEELELAVRQIVSRAISSDKRSCFVWIGRRCLTRVIFFPACWRRRPLRCMATSGIARRAFKDVRAFRAVRG
jgi:hypothetical protein